MELPVVVEDGWPAWTKIYCAATAEPLIFLTEFLMFFSCLFLVFANQPLAGLVGLRIVPSQQGLCWFRAPEGEGVVSAAGSCTVYIHTAVCVPIIFNVL